MARLALCAVGLALAAPSARADPRAPADQTGLFQIGKSVQETDWKMATEESSRDGFVMQLETSVDGKGEKPKQVPIQGYAPEDYKEGTLVETQMPNGEWVLATIWGRQANDTWDIKTPGADLSGVPAKVLRRRLNDGEADWIVFQKYKDVLKGCGIDYRLSKNKEDIKSKSCAPYNHYVVGKTETNGWVKTGRGYLPMEEQSVQVLAQRERKGTVAMTKELRDWYLHTEEDRRKDLIAKAALEPPPLPGHFTKDEEVLFRTTDLKLHHARVQSTAALTTYSVLVQPAHESEYVIPRANPAQLRKLGPPKHTPVKGESPVCTREGGCIHVIMRAPGKEHEVQVAMGITFHFLHEAACRVLESANSCQTRVSLLHHGQLMNPWWRIFETDLKNGDYLDMKLAPESETPVPEVSATTPM